MEKYQKDYLIAKQVDLMELINANTTLLAHLQSKGIIGKPDIAQLDTYKNQMDKSWELIKMLMLKENGYNALVEATDHCVQTGAVAILKKISPEIQSQNETQLQAMPPTSSTGSSNPGNSSVTTRPVQYKLTINEKDVVNGVLVKVQSGLMGKMRNQRINIDIILDLLTMCYFDRKTVEHLITGKNLDEQNRMNQLFEVIADLESDEILGCLERLCNLKDYPAVSGKFRNVLNEYFPGCV